MKLSLLNVDMKTQTVFDLFRWFFLFSKILLSRRRQGKKIISNVFISIKKQSSSVKSHESFIFFN